MAHVDYLNLQDDYYNDIQYCQSLKVGDKIKFQSEKQRYTIQAKNDRYLICTKPFNARKTYLYTIIDLERLVRGALNLIFGTIYNLDNLVQAQKCIEDLEKGEYEVSHRNCLKLDVVVQKTDKTLI